MIGNKERFYPLGTAVRLKDNSGIFVIIGLMPQISEGVVADYLAVRYPCGYEAAPESQFVFNAEASSKWSQTAIATRVFASWKKTLRSLNSAFALLPG